MPEPPTKKRSRYTSIACNECKRRKIKCNGEKPCERCGNQTLDCIYDSPNFQDSDEYRRMNEHIETLQTQVETLFSMVKEMKAEQDLWRSGGSAGGRVDDVRTGLESTSANGIVQRATRPGPRGIELAEDNSGNAHNGDTAPRHRPSAGGMEIDMSHGDGRISSVHSINSAAADVAGLDPLLGISRVDTIALWRVYTTQIHPLYPLLDLRDIMYRFDRCDTLKDQLLGRGPRGADPVSSKVVHDPSQMFSDVTALMCKMALAIAAHAQDPGSRLACRLFANVQLILSKQSPLPGWSTESSPHITTSNHAVPPMQVLFDGMRLRMLHALWSFQHGEENEALAVSREAVRVHKAIGAHVANEPGTTPESATAALIIGGHVYSTYWRWAVMLKSVPRFDTTLERLPPRRYDDEDPMGYEEDDSAAGPALFEYAKLCSVTCFAFERPSRELAALAVTKPPWGKDSAVDHCHRWQGNFTMGLKSLACIRPGFLASKSEGERILLSAIYLYAHFLRMRVCQYKRSGTTDLYDGPISELYDSAKYAHESITVLWDIHQTGKAWTTHTTLCNIFMYNSGAWLYDLFQDGAIRPSDEVKVSMQRTLAMLETYGRHWDKSKVLLDKLQDARRSGALS